jgi:uncharacterized protein YkuJ
MRLTGFALSVNEEERKSRAALAEINGESVTEVEYSERQPANGDDSATNG